MGIDHFDRLRRRSFDLRVPTILGVFFVLIGNALDASAAPLFFVGGPADGVYSVDPANPADGGTLLAAHGTGGLDGANGLSINSNGDLLVSSSNNGVIAQYDNQGNFTNLFSDDPSLVQPSRSVLGPQGNMFVTEGNLSGIVELSAKGKAIGSLNVPNVSGTPQQFITALALGPDSDLYVGVAGPQGGSVLRFNGQTGQYIDSFISSGTLQVPAGLSFGPFGFLYVSSYNLADAGGNAALQRFSGGSGKFLDTISTVQLDNMAFGPDGKLYGLADDKLYQLGVSSSNVAHRGRLSDLVVADGRVGQSNAVCAQHRPRPAY